jgi:predicted anti-sigma-YlaC factor YlaD
MTASVHPVRRHRERCRETRKQMSDYLDGELENSTQVERHLAWCPNCRRMLLNLRRTVDGLHHLHEEEPLG